VVNSKPILLWIDCKAGLPDPEYRVRCSASFDVAQAESIAVLPQDIARHKPGALCFDFDYPDQQRLQAMAAIKKSFPRLPILMLTLEHSERLAVWAFRSRVWNYLVKPVPAGELAETLQALSSLCHRTAAPRVAQMLDEAAPDDMRAEPLDPEVARLQPGLQYVAQHYHERISAWAAARSCGLSRFEFSRKFRAAFGMTFREYLLRARINEARRLLMGGAISVTGVAYSVGFNDGSHFARMFRRFTGVLPSAYRDSDLVRTQHWRRRTTDQAEALPGGA
jgi:AraC-like DNA-binding protein